MGSLLARFQLTEGPSKPAPLAVQFTSEGSTLSGCDIELAGPGYRFSLIKKRFAAGQFSILATTVFIIVIIVSMFAENFHQLLIFKNFPFFNLYLSVSVSVGLGK